MKKRTKVSIFQNMELPTKYLSTALFNFTAILLAFRSSQQFMYIPVTTHLHLTVIMNAREANSIATFLVHTAQVNLCTRFQWDSMRQLGNIMTTYSNTTGKSIEVNRHDQSCWAAVVVLPSVETLLRRKIGNRQKMNGRAN